VKGGANGVSLQARFPSQLGGFQVSRGGLKAEERGGGKGRLKARGTHHV
jgi:hypothetical protein